MTKLDEVRKCPFCGSNTEAARFNESENFLAIYNIAPILPGHSLIIPKRHVASLLELDDQEFHEMMAFSRDTTRLLLAVFKSSGFDWTIQEGEEAGQTVPHLHLHLIPRTPNDLSRPGDWYPLVRESKSKVIDSSTRSRLTADEMQSIVAKIRKFAAREK